MSGWDWYTGADAAGIGGQQYDFQTVVTHEMGHALGLGHSSDSTSVMYASLNPGEVRRLLREDDLSIPTYQGGDPQLLQDGTPAGGHGSGCGCPYCNGAVRAAGVRSWPDVPIISEGPPPLLRREDEEQAALATGNGKLLVASWTSGSVLPLAPPANVHGVPAKAADMGTALCGGLGEEMVIGESGRDSLIGGFRSDRLTDGLDGLPFVGEGSTREEVVAASSDEGWFLAHEDAADQDITTDLHADDFAAGTDFLTDGW